MSQNTVSKYECEPENRQLISTEKTTVITNDGSTHNGDLLYTTRLIQLALDRFHEHRLAQKDVAVKRHRAAKALALRSGKERPA